MRNAKGRASAGSDGDGSAFLKGSASLLESAFPAYAVSRIAAADRRTRDPAYSAHLWWGRRPPAVMRAILVAATLNADCDEDSFWKAYGSDGPVLGDVRVLDPFMGGGCTLVEASRLGASVEGIDVDPTAQLIVAHALEPPDSRAVLEAGSELIAYLRGAYGALFPDCGGEPLHWFWLPVVTCPQCGETGLLYRSLVLARDVGKPGGVVRDEPVTVFDPESLKLHYLRSASYGTFRGEQRRWPLDHATFKERKYQCSRCGRRSSHRDLQTGAAPTKLLAVERTPLKRRRRLVPPTAHDLQAVELAGRMLADPPTELRLPVGEFDEERTDPRPRSYGITSVSDLFTARQMLVLGAAHSWIDRQSLDAPTERALRLALSNALATNNRLCSYATDYGRLAPLFNIHGYALPALSVELNPLHSRGGRGTLLQCIRRVARSSATKARRSVWSPSTSSVQAREFDFSGRAPAPELRCCSAADSTPSRPVDLLVFDPPFYDYLAYDELAELFRAWSLSPTLGGRPLQAEATAGASSFGVALADCLRPAVAARRPVLPVVLTYHSTNPHAWEAVGVALDELKLAVTAMWPVRSDGHMGHHTQPGNCEWDVIIACRPISETVPTTATPTVNDWQRLAGDLPISDADRAGFACALGVASTRWALPAIQQHP